MTAPTLKSGTSLGPYTIVSPLGAGGMGEVYRARDPRLGRDVAIKVLPLDLAAIPGARARFEREARAVSALVHPHICMLLDVGHQDGLDYLVMELFEGETLATRLERGPLATDSVLRMGIEIADALDGAHRKGIVHRDLKPSNIMLGPSGAKLMDFGIAKAIADTGLTQGLPTLGGPERPADLSDSFTGEGRVLGTAHYLAPEVLRGRPADARSDLFSFGAVLYEAATGRRAFLGADRTGVLAAILEDEPPPMRSMIPGVPAILERIVSRCLAKDPEERWQNARDLMHELRWIAGARQAGRGLLPAAGAPRRFRGAGALVMTALIATLAVGVWQLRRVLVAPGPVLHAEIVMPEGVHLMISGDEGGPPELSSDGGRLALVGVGSDGVRRVWVRPLGERSAAPVPGTEDATFPFWAPDGRSLGFFARGRLMRVDLAGGAPVSICDAFSGRGGSWGPDGTIIYAPYFRSGIFAVPAAGGTPREIVPRDSAVHTTYRWPRFLPDGKRFLFFAALHPTPPGSNVGTFVASLDGREKRALRRSSSNAVYSAGHLLFVENGRLLAQPFDPARARLSGRPAETHLRVGVDPTTWRANFTASDRGTVVYEIAGAHRGTRIKWFDRAGRNTGTTGASGDYVNLRLSPDARRLAVEVRKDDAGDIWIWDLERDSSETFVTAAAPDAMPCWTPDGREILFTSNRPSFIYLMWRKSLAGGPELPFGSELDNTWPEDPTPDGRELVFGQGGYFVPRRGALWALPLAGGSQPRQLSDDLARHDRARVSPDGRWLAYTRADRQSGGDQILVVPFDREGRHREAGNSPPPTSGQISTQGGSRPRWRADSRELYYVRGNRTIVAVRVDGRGREFRVLHETALFDALQRSSRNSYDVTPDGRRFVLITLEPSAGTSLATVSDWRRQVENR